MLHDSNHSIYSFKMSVSSRDLCFVLKERAELVHKVHLLCLLARGRIVDNACNDPLIQVNKLYPFSTALLAVALKIYVSYCLLSLQPAINLMRRLPCFHFYHHTCQKS